jgi:hypothetical protein
MTRVDTDCEIGPTASRRDLLLGLAGMGFTASLAGRVCAQQAAPTVLRIDLHHHFFATGPLAQKYWANAPSLRPIMQYAPTQSLDAMSQAGVGTAFLSSPIPFGDDRIGDQHDARILARETNELGAKMVTEHRGRFGLFAVLPLPDVDGSLREIEYAFDTLKADGVGLLTSYGNRWLGSETFAPVFFEAVLL